MYTCDVFDLPSYLKPKDLFRNPLRLNGSLRGALMTACPRSLLPKLIAFWGKLRDTGGGVD